MTDPDPRVSAWSKPDAPASSPGRAAYRAHMGEAASSAWAYLPSVKRERLARMAVAAIDACFAGSETWPPTAKEDQGDAN